MVNVLVYLDNSLDDLDAAPRPCADSAMAVATTGFGPLLITCARLLDEVAQAQVNREVGAAVARPALMRLVPHLDRHGIRPSELARRVDLTKQAVGQTLKACEAQGFVEFTADPDDGRAQLVRLTADGEAAYRYGTSVLAFLEDELGRAVGDHTLQHATDALARLLPLLQQWSTGQAPTRRAPREAAALARRARRGR